MKKKRWMERRQSPSKMFQFSSPHRLDGWLDGMDGHSNPINPMEGFKKGGGKQAAGAIGTKEWGNEVVAEMNGLWMGWVLGWFGMNEKKMGF
jgi:hypothetical protein